MFKLEKSLKCETCVNALTGTDNRTFHSLISLKNKGPLIHPSDDVINICIFSEKKFRESYAMGIDLNIELHKNGFKKILISVLDYFTNKDVFTKSSQHMFETEAVNNHIALLIQAMAEKYLQVRHYYAAKQFTAEL